MPPRRSRSTRWRRAREPLWAELIAAAQAGRQAAIAEEALAGATLLGAEGIELASWVFQTVELATEATAQILEGRLRAALDLGRWSERNPVPNRSTGVLTDPTTGGRSRDALPMVDGIRFGTTRTMPSGAPGVSAEDSSMVAIVGGDGAIIRFLHSRAEQLPSPGTVTALESSLEALNKIRPDLWETAVQGLLPHLPAPPDTVRAVCGRLGRAMNEAIVIEALAPPLPKWLTPEPFAVRAQAERARVMSALTTLVPYLAELERATLRGVWQGLLTAFSAEPRPLLLMRLDIVAPLIGVLGGRDAATATVKSIEQFGSWWP